MGNALRYNVSDQRLVYEGKSEPKQMNNQRKSAFNQRHKEVLGFYGIELHEGTVFTIDDRVNGLSNLGVFRSKQLRQSAVLAAALPAAAVVLHGYNAFSKVPKDLQTKDLANRYKRMNDRTAAQVMAEVLQLTTENLETGEEVIIESAITEGVRVKPGVELGGNPTIAVGALFGKDKDKRQYGRGLGPEVKMLSMGSDVIDGTTKSITGQHRSLTALFITESGVKRHLPDIYIERWMAGAPFPTFNPRDTDIREEAEIIASAYGMKNFEDLSAFFINRPRHEPAMNQLNSMGVATPYDNDGDLYPALVMGLDGLKFPDGRPLNSMIGEIGGSAEWAVGCLPLAWRGGKALGMLTSQSSLTRKDLSPEELWAERFHYTEEEHMLLHDARFEQKPYFTIEDILERPFDGGISAFCSISDCYYLPQLKGVFVDAKNNLLKTNTLMINSLGVVEHWQLIFKCLEGVEKTAEKMASPKNTLRELDRAETKDRIMTMLDNEVGRFRLRLFFECEYYPAIIHTEGKMVLLSNTIETLIKRGAMSEHDRDIVQIVQETAPGWFASSA